MIQALRRFDGVLLRELEHLSQQALLLSSIIAALA
jgi:hypothetical protein